MGQNTTEGGSPHLTLWPGQCLGSVGPPLPLRSAQKGQGSCHFSSFKGNRLEEQYRMSASGCRISDYRQEAGLGVRCQGNQPLVKKETVRWVKSKKVQDISREPRKSDRELVLTRGCCLEARWVQHKVLSFTPREPIHCLESGGC